MVFSTRFLTALLYSALNVCHLKAEVVEGALLIGRRKFGDGGGRAVGLCQFDE